MNNLIIVMWVVGAVSIAVLATRTSRGDAIATALMMLMVMVIYNDLARLPWFSRFLP